MEDYEGWADLLPRTGNPVLDAAVIVSVGAIVVVGALVVLWVKVKPWLEEIRSDTKVVRAQTENSHTDAPNPNLRDDLDAKHRQLERNHRELRDRQDTQAKQVLALSEQIQETMSEIRKEFAGVRADLSNDRESMRRVEAQLDAHMEKARASPGECCKGR